MSTTVKTGWLKDNNGDKFAPKTLTSQVQTSDGVLLEDKIQADLNAAKSDWSQTDETAIDFIKNKPDIATDDEILDMLTQEDMLPVVADSDGALLSDENENILLW